MGKVAKNWDRASKDWWVASPSISLSLTITTGLNNDAQLNQ